MLKAPLLILKPSFSRYYNALMEIWVRSDLFEVDQIIQILHIPHLVLLGTMISYKAMRTPFYPLCKRTPTLQHVQTYPSLSKSLFEQVIKLCPAHLIGAALLIALGWTLIRNVCTDVLRSLVNWVSSIPKRSYV